MNLTDERAEMLADYLGEDADRAEKLFSMTAEEAVAAINADGYDFTAEELKAFVQKVQKTKMQAGGELSDEELDSISGGGIPSWLWKILKLAVSIDCGWD